MGKYDPLRKHLDDSGDEKVILSFAEIEKIIGNILPPSASTQNSWWENVNGKSNGHSQAKAWQNAGYKAKVDLKQKKVLFFKENTFIRNYENAFNPHSNGSLKDSEKINAGRLEITARKTGNEATIITLCGYSFRFIQQLIPNCKDGNVIKYYPQRYYDNIKKLPLNRNGDGAFCKFSVNVPAASGVYIWVVNDEIVYIGETEDFSVRFNQGYGNISPRNCFIDGQNTNCKMNKVVMEHYEKNTPISLYIYETRNYKEIERELLRCHNTKYNVKNNSHFD